MKNLLIYSLALIVLCACKKEAQIEKNLWKKGGEWDVSEWYNYYNQSLGGVTVSNTDHYYNTGTFKFNKDGSGTMDLTMDGDKYYNTFTYENTSNTLTITYKNGSFFEAGERYIYDLDWKKDEIKLRNIDNSDGYYDEYQITLKKK